MNIHILDTNNHAGWDAFVRDSKAASIYHLSSWQGIIESVFGHQTFYLYATEKSKKISGVLPIVRLKSALFGDFMVSVPYFNYGGVIAKDTATEHALMQYACKLCDEVHSSHIEFRDTVERPDQWQIRTDKVVMELPLPNDSDELWKSFKPKIRAQVRKPTKEGAVSQSGGVELLDEFYKVFSVNMRDLGTPVYPKSFFREILSTFPDSAFITVIRYKGMAIAAGFLLGYGEKLEIPWASSLRKYNSLGANMLLYWEVIAQAIEKGYQVFDFGRSSLNSGTYRFKKQWGAQSRQLYWHYYLRDGGSLPDLTPNNPKYRMAINIWQRMPLGLCNYLGPKIVKYLP